MRVTCAFLLAALVGGAQVAAVESVAAAPACEPDRLAEKYPSLVGRTLKIGADPQTPPYVMRKEGDLNQIVGIDADLARAVFDCHGIEYEFLLGGWSGLLPATVSGQIDVFWNNLYYTSERAKQIDYVIYMQAGTGALATAGNPAGVNEMADLCGLTVAAGLGTVEEAAVRAESEACTSASKAAINVMTFPDVASGVRLVDSGRADILLFDLAVVDALAIGSPDRYARAFVILSGFQIGAGVRNREDELLQAIYEGLSVVQATGKQAAIFKAYSVGTELMLPAEIKRD